MRTLRLPADALRCAYCGREGGRLATLGPLLAGAGAVAPSSNLTGSRPMAVLEGRYADARGGERPRTGSAVAGEAPVGDWLRTDEGLVTISISWKTECGGGSRGDILAAWGAGAVPPASHCFAASQQ